MNFPFNLLIILLRYADANWKDGLCAYSYDDNSLVNTAHIVDSTKIRDVAVGPDGTIFAIYEGDLFSGLREYIYD